MEEVYFSSEKNYDQTLFSEKITQNKWVLYHGTSSVFKEDIIKNGLKRLSISKNLVKRFIEIYEESGILEIDRRVNGFNTASDRYLHLRSFTMGVDFSGDNTTKPIYFSDRVDYALTYTQSEYLGGETISAINRCLIALKEYCGNDSYRNLSIKELWKRMEKSYLNRGFRNHLPKNLRKKNHDNGTEEEYKEIYDCVTEFIRRTNPNFIESNLRRSIFHHEELREALEEISLLVEPYITTNTNHSSGIVLAIEFESCDLSNFRIRKSGLDHGFGYDNEIEPKKIIGICHVDEGIINSRKIEEIDYRVRERRKKDPEDILYHMETRNL